MFHRPRWSARFAALAASTAIAVSACGAAATPAPTTAPSQAASQAASQSTAPSAAAFTGISWPATAVDCANKPKDYTGEISQIKAVDQYTVEFDLCVPDVAFLSKIAFSSNNIQDSDWLKAHAADKSLVTTTNGTGPYMVTEWVKGDHINLAANPNYWGTPAKAPKLVVKWSTEAAQRLQELQAGTVDGIDNVGPDDFDKVKADTNLKLYLRQALNNLYLGFNVGDAPWDKEPVRQALAMGIDRKRIADNFYPAGSEAADFFTPCAIPFGCNGDKWYEFDKAKAKQMLTDAGFDFSKTYDFHYRTKVRSYLPSPTQVATDIQAQLKDNLGVTIKLVVEKDDTYLTDSSKGKFPLFLLGWGADYPDMTDFLDYHFGTGANSAFGPKFKDLDDKLTAAASETDATKRGTLYTDANNLVKLHVPMVPLVHGGSATAFKADVADAHSSPIGNEALWTMTPGTRDTLIWMQNSEPSGLYCGDESDGDALRICQQISDSLYQYKVAGLETEPALAESCTPSTDLKTWTCKLRQGVKFAVSGTLDANDVVDTYAAQWDAKNPLHVGRAGTFDYFPALFGGFLNPPPPAP